MEGQEIRSTWLRDRWALLLWTGAAVLLCAPLIAALFTDDVRWTALDFAVMGGLLAALCAAIHLALRFGPNLPYKLGAAAALLGAFALTWINLAVGREHHPDDYIIFGALAIGLILSALVRFRARGMSVAMLVTAIAMMIALRIAIAHQTDADGPNLLVVGVGSAFVGGPFLLAAWLFRRAAKSNGAA